jgi:hypothetical protein
MNKPSSYYLDFLLALSCEDELAIVTYPARLI